MKTKIIAYTALFAGLGLVFNLISNAIPSAGGFLGRASLVYSFCYLSGIFLGPWFGGIAAGVADIIQTFIDGSFANFVPQITISNIMMAIIAGLMFHYVTKPRKDYVRIILSGVICYFVCSLGMSAWGEAMLLFDIYPYTVAKSLGATLGISSKYLMLALAKAISQPLWIVLNLILTIAIVEPLKKYIVFGKHKEEIKEDNDSVNELADKATMNIK